MILADKIINLRKKEGWSQEMLAEKMGVSRQSISKWEGAQAIPDMNKILLLSELFGVSTDYLLRDDMEIAESVPEQFEPRTAIDGEEAVSVSMETANAFLNQNESSAPRFALGVFLCIISPIVLIILASHRNNLITGLTDDKRAMIGLIVLFILVGAAVAIFVTNGMRSNKYKDIREKPIETAYGVRGMVRERMAQYESAHIRDMTLGIVLCVVATISVFVAILLRPEDELAISIGVGMLLFIVACGVYLIVRTSCIWGGYQALIEDGDYRREQKRADNSVGGIYWLSVTAIYLAVSFLTASWALTWIIWPVAGVLYGAVVEIFKNRRS